MLKLCRACHSPPASLQVRFWNFCNNYSSTSTLSPEEVLKFEKMSWWDTEGDFKPLHSMNKLRIDLIATGLHNNSQIETRDTEKYLNGISILDIGCGGGILSQPLGRLGANVIGIDAGSENIKIAQKFLPSSLEQNVNFICSTIEKYAEDNCDNSKFDAIVASEVIEHVENQKFFIQTAAQLLKPSGSFFLTTINRSTASYLCAIILAENLLKLLPRGTHDWSKFISPTEVQQELNNCGIKTRGIYGMSYNPVCNSWKWTQSTAINYALHGVKED